MKKVSITVGDYDVELLKKIFENEAGFEPRDDRDKLLIQLMRQIIENPKEDI